VAYAGIFSMELARDILGRKQLLYLIGVVHRSKRFRSGLLTQI